MAEGLLGGVLGDDGEKSEVELPGAANGIEAFASAIAAKLAGNDPEVARDTSTFLKKQAHLLEIQAEHLKDEHEARLHCLRGQAREVDIRRFGQRIRVGVQVFFLLVAFVIGIYGVIMIVDAFSSNRVIIEPFDVPPSLVEKGLNSKVVAEALLDNLSHLQDATRSSEAARGLTSAWTDDIKLDVPETGVSVGEALRLLRDRFGHDVHVGGNVFESPTGSMVLTVRGNGVPSMTFTGPATDSEKLIVEAAEYVYSKSQPARWATYLYDMERYTEVIAFCRASFASADLGQRAGLLELWARAIQYSGGSTREALGLLKVAVKLNPEFWVARSDIQGILVAQGDEEGAWRAGEEMRMAAGGRPGRARGVDYAYWDQLTWNAYESIAASVADAESNAGAGSTVTAEGPVIADIQWRLHDVEAADLALKTTKEDPHDPNIEATTHFVRGRLAAELGDTAQAVAEMETFGVAYANPAVFTFNAGYNCWIAPAEEAAGYPKKADLVLKTGGSYVDCYRFRADILEGRGDWTGAKKSYEEAVALAPDLPAAYYSWGVALAKHGDLTGATAKLHEANQRGPHWADPLKALGDVLVTQSRFSDALAKYDEALKYAPNWKQLKEAREALAKRKR
jgi:tetratricopeptide (TPR) repeat protein